MKRILPVACLLLALLITLLCCRLDSPATQPFAVFQKPSARGTITLTLQCTEPVTEKTTEEVNALGGRVIAYLPQQALLIEADKTAFTRLSGSSSFSKIKEVQPADKISHRLKERMQSDAKQLDIVIVPQTQEDIPFITQALIENGGHILIHEPNEEGRFICAAAPLSAITVLAARGDVQWMNPYQRFRLLNDIAVTEGQMDVKPVWDNLGLTGKGQVISVSDSGLDTGDKDNLKNKDFQNRVLKIQTYHYPYQGHVMVPQDWDGHGTHVAGSIAGSGANSNGQFKGVAHEAQLNIWACCTETEGIYTPPISTLFSPAETSAYIHSCSWGNETYEYTAASQETDLYLWQNPQVLPVVAAGNEGKKAGCTISEIAYCKNVLTVGAVENLRKQYKYGRGSKYVAYFSSKGPTDDGRIKPDITAPGTLIISTRSSQATYTNPYDDNYAYMSGTSMATPLTAGTVALVRQWLMEQREFVKTIPSAALMKAILLGGALDITTPNGSNGWGRVSLKNALAPEGRAVILKDYIPFSQNSSFSCDFTTTNAAPFDASLVWVDYPANPSATIDLVNNLDLVISNRTTGAVWYGNDFSNKKVRDSINNVEIIRLETLPAGDYTAYVEGREVPQNSTQGGAAALYLSAAVKDQVTVSCYDYFQDIGRYWETHKEFQVPRGTELTLKLPQDTACEAETVSYPNEKGTYRLALWDYTMEDDGTIIPLIDSQKRMSRTQTFKAYRDYTFTATYIKEDTINKNYSTFPLWWYYRYLAFCDSSEQTATSDPDGDGVSNDAEYQAGTDPLDNTSKFEITAFTPTNIIWHGSTWRRQVLEAKANWSDDWKEVLIREPPTSTVVTQKLDAVSREQNRFFRIKVL